MSKLTERGGETEKQRKE